MPAPTTHWRYAWADDHQSMVRLPIVSARVNADGFVTGCLCDACRDGQRTEQEREAERIRAERAEAARLQAEEDARRAREAHEAEQRTQRRIAERNAEFPLTPNDTDRYGGVDEEHIEGNLRLGCDKCKGCTHDYVPARLGQHSVTPVGGWATQHVADERYTYGLGIELETDNKEGRVSDTDIVGMAQPMGFWVAGPDGSVSGPEFKSQPATLDYWRAHYADLEDFFRSVLHAGYRSHDGNAAGLHTNISVGAFDGADHFYKFSTLVYAAPNWSMRMAQRVTSSGDRWANMNRVEVADDEWRRRDIEACFASNGQRGLNTQRYVALNMQNFSNGRIEFRLPRGTLRIDRFFKNLEWVTAMIEYARTHSEDAMHPKMFMEWVMEEVASEFTYLADFLVEKFGQTKREIA